ncbi:MAG TPA: heme NO-binding domain-containing protein, partial [Gaiellaceae bacterium]|nr:heme NO-binding domain-containing protein [Gaiellaceae bacterium]
SSRGARRWRSSEATNGSFPEDPVHGLIFSSLRDFSVERLGTRPATALWDDRVFELTQSYDDEWFIAQLERLAAATGESPDEVLRGFGSFAAQRTFAGLYPAYYAENDDTFSFLLGVEQKIHELVRATVAGAYPPKLHVQPLNEVGVLISYTSERGLCRLLEGLVRGTAEHYGETVVVEEIQCMRRDEPACVFTVMQP